MSVPIPVHVVAGLWIAGMVVYGMTAPEQYRLLLQEDRMVEWATVWLFLVAGVGFALSAVRGRLSDGFVALFCLFVAGEEFSWGQRLLGYYPPEFFLANNFQQEANIHNLPQTFLQPKWVLMAVLAAYGMALPLMATRSRMRSVIARFRVTPPPLALVPWFAAAIVLLLWYPLTLTGEWVEALAGGLFFISSGIFSRTWWAALGAIVVLAAVMSAVSGRLEGSGDAARIACAAHEVRGLSDDIATGSAGTDGLWAMRRIHKRVWSASVENYLQADRFAAFTQACAGAPSAETLALRHKYAIDPWGSPYWLLVEQSGEEQRRVTVYSFGPNRRRDLSDEVTGGGDVGDDILAVATRPD